MIFPVALFLYMSIQTRYFGRWLLMMYPLLALFVGIAVVTLASWVAERVAAPACAGAVRRARRSVWRSGS